MKKIFRIVLVIVSLAMIHISLSAQQKSEFEKAVGRYNQLLFYIDRLYLEKPELEDLVEKAIGITVSELDPHSAYISAENVKAMNEPLQGEFEGIGIEFAIIRDTLTVQATIAGGPSEAVGLLAGDRIIKVDTAMVAGVGLGNKDVHRYLRGKKGTRVKLDVLRKGVPDVLEFIVTRDKIPITSVDAAYEAADGVLYVKLSRFAAKSRDEIADAIKSFDGVINGMILDLRSNSGGYLPTAIGIANEFLSAGDMIVYTEGRAFPQMQERAKGNGLYRKGRLVVLIDENSASASEIVSGAVQDQDRGLVVGRRSFGKGLVQQAIPMSDGAELRLTVARYHTPSGRVIQSPYEKGNTEKYYKDFYERFVRGESFNRDSIHFPDSLKYKTLKLNRTVYGGGGIMPDVFVPKDTADYTGYYAALLRQGLVVEYMNNLCDQNRVEWKSRYGSFEEFDMEFVITKKMKADLVALASERGIEYDDVEFGRSECSLSQYMKALAASSLYSRDCFYKVMNEEDADFATALRIITFPEEYQAALSSCCL